MVGSKEDQGVFGQPVGLERAQHLAGRRIQHAHAGLEGGKIGARLRSVGKGRGRQRIARVFGGAGLVKSAVRLGESYREPERLPALCGDWPVTRAARLGEQVGAPLKA